MLNLPFGLSFPNLYARDGLVRVDAAFVETLVRTDGELCRRLVDARDHPDALAVHPIRRVQQSMGSNARRQDWVPHFLRNWLQYCTLRGIIIGRNPHAAAILNLKRVIVV